MRDRNNGIVEKWNDGWKDRKHGIMGIKEIFQPNIPLFQHSIIPIPHRSMMPVFQHSNSAEKERCGR
jgi:hypothetical protein